MMSESYESVPSPPDVFTNPFCVVSNFVAFSYYSNDITGQIFTFFVLTVAAAEAAVGLAIIVIYYKNKGSIHVEQISSLKG